MSLMEFLSLSVMAAATGRTQSGVATQYIVVTAVSGASPWFSCRFDTDTCGSASFWPGMLGKKWKTE